MAKYLILAKLQASTSGANKGDVIAIRPHGSPVTAREKREFLVVQVDLSEEEYNGHIAKLRPRATYVYDAIDVPDADSDPDGYQAYLAAEAAARNAEPLHGLRVNLEHESIIEKTTDLNNPNITVEPFEVTKAVIEEKS